MVKASYIENQFQMGFKFRNQVLEKCQSLKIKGLFTTQIQGRGPAEKLAYLLGRGPAWNYSLFEGRGPVQISTLN